MKISFFWKFYLFKEQKGPLFKNRKKYLKMEMITSRTNADLQRSKTNMNQSTVYLDNLK